MKKFTLIITLLLSFFFTPLLKAQFVINAELRTRAEANHGFQSLPVESSQTAFFISQRTRLNLKYTHDKFTTYFSLQDVRLWGQEDIASKTGIQASIVGLDVSQAWLNWEFAKNWGLKTGRQIWDYDDGRILASRNWNQTALSYDALLIHFDKDDFHFHFGSSINNAYTSFNRDTDLLNYYNYPYGYRIKYFNFLWLKFHASDKFSISLAEYVASYLDPNTTSTYYNLSTTGAHLDYHSEKLKILANVFYQLYQKPYSDKYSNAFMLTFSANYQVNKVNLGVGADYLSGEDEDGNNAFNLMYGARFKYYGWMNYFILSKDSKEAGLIDIYPNIKFKINNKHSVCATYHAFWTSEDLGIMDGGDFSYLTRNLGGEIDLGYKYVYDKSFRIQMNLGYYFANETTEFVKGIPKGTSTTPIWASIMLTYKPEFFSTEK